MPKRAEQTLTPRLRFPEFIGQTLREVQLKDVTAESTTRNGDKLPITSVMGVRKAEGIVPMEERIIASDIARYKIVQKEWFAYNPMRLNIGSIAQWKGENDILVSPDYIVFKCLTDADSGIDPSYLNHFRQSAAWENVVTEGGDGSVRVRIYYKDLARLYLALPPFIEQQKLADCLTSLDEVIAAQGRKVAALKAHKRGLMQQLFPREGETHPRLRFPEFRNAPEWEESSLDSCFSHVRNGFVGTATPFYVNDGGVPYLQGKNVKKGQIDSTGLIRITESFHERQKKSQLRTGDIVMVQSGHVGECAYIGDQYSEANCHALIIMTPKDHQHSPFFVHCFGSDYGKRLIFQITTGNTIKHILASDVKELLVCVPQFAEQKRIADCLSSLNAQITAEANQLAALKTHKQGLMQQLFPSPESAAI